MVVYILLLLFTAIVYKLDLVKTINNTINIKKRKLKNLSTLVRTQYKNVFMILWVCICIIAKNFYMSILQKLNQTVVNVGKNEYEINYVIKGIRYTMRIHCKKGPPNLIQALDENDNDITEIIQAYAGPDENFHRRFFTPSQFGLKGITLSLSSGQDRIFKENEMIII
jgi:hypothetical protein